MTDLHEEIGGSFHCGFCGWTGDPGDIEIDICPNCMDDDDE